MREIKFRGLSINGEWHYGLLSHMPIGPNTTERGYYISNSLGLPRAYLVRSETVGQFTGLHDKNGKDIYEGDIVDGMEHIYEKYYDDLRQISFRSEVKFIRSAFCILINKGWRELPHYQEEGEFIEIIGNKFENPELMETIKCQHT